MTTTPNDSTNTRADIIEAIKSDLADMLGLFFDEQVRDDHGITLTTEEERAIMLDAATYDPTTPAPDHAEEVARSDRDVKAYLASNFK